MYENSCLLYTSKKYTIFEMVSELSYSTIIIVCKAVTLLGSYYLFVVIITYRIINKKCVSLIHFFLQ